MYFSDPESELTKASTSGLLSYTLISLVKVTLSLKSKSQLQGWEFFLEAGKSGILVLVLSLELA